MAQGPPRGFHEGLCIFAFLGERLFKQRRKALVCEEPGVRGTCGEHPVIHRAAWQRAPL